tara:strand:+ start:1593 stop:1787 length:195 start_codon:yes stop_codon:yes gene_type:complete
MSTLQDIEDVQRGEAWYIANATEAWATVAECRRTMHIMLWIIVAMAAGFGVCAAALVYVAAVAA